ncbi:uroporphyrinogen-III synthase [Cognatishimia sp. SS12]|uniref:uroporphyrinogen-III synthase n=1 Tax=Cognatishimia sp. SS12 TaxID=2979465 RepID=UPI00232C069D|nr:uroporphyrinogen-III synthase [Cognatishimia sp. SS12]MDC0737778.1 uroporphyrinogen-III synthase [Cognatishimia sp. SS12]
MTQRPPLVLLTRPAERAQQFATQLTARGWNGPLLCAPLQEVAPTETPASLREGEAAIFSSATAVAMVPPELSRRAAPAYCVGVHTTAAARAAGWQADMYGATADALVARLIAKPPKKALVHLRGRYSRGAICARLTAAGLSVRESVIYAQRALALSAEASAALSGRDPVIVPLFSPRSAALFAKSAPGNAPLWIVSMSEAVQAELDGMPIARHVVAKTPDAASMLDAIFNLGDAA